MEKLDSSSMGTLDAMMTTMRKTFLAKVDSLETRFDDAIARIERMDSVEKKIEASVSTAIAELHRVSELVDSINMRHQHQDVSEKLTEMLAKHDRLEAKLFDTLTAKLESSMTLLSSNVNASMDASMGTLDTIGPTIRSTFNTKVDILETKVDDAVAKMNKIETVDKQIETAVSTAVNELTRVSNALGTMNGNFGNLDVSQQVVSLNAKVDHLESRLFDNLSGKLDSSMAQLSNTVNASVGASTGTLDTMMSSMRSTFSTKVDSLETKVNDAVAKMGKIENVDSKIETAVSTAIGDLTQKISRAVTPPQLTVRPNTRDIERSADIEVRLRDAVNAQTEEICRTLEVQMRAGLDTVRDTMLANIDAKLDEAKAVQQKELKVMIDTKIGKVDSKVNALDAKLDAIMAMLRRSSDLVL